ncbi:MAG: NAD(P)H-hydrate dehydratase [Desulfobacteraceae bacterium]|nr:NAD(P)H-hydrate dehydratase [Desulfobacteraceae bacterium]
MYLVTAQEMQDMDRETIEEFGIPGRVLMENAGRGSVDMLVRLFPYINSKRVCVLAGRGNNGGDGFVVARYLIQMGVKTDIFLLSQRSKVTGDALANLELAEKLVEKYPDATLTEVPDLESFDRVKPRIVHGELIVDAILGTGLNSDVRGYFKTVIQTVNELSCPIFSIDIPSGLNADTGLPWGVAINAFATATFAFAKAGHFLLPGKELTGELEIVDIGIPPFIREQFDPKLTLVESRDVAKLFPLRQLHAHKGNFGHLAVVAGSTGKTGAAALAANAAMTMGAGLVTLGIPASLNPAVEPQVTETMTFPLAETVPGQLSDTAMEELKQLAEGKTAMALGPGIGTAPATQALVRKIISEIDLPLVIDADGLNAIAEDPGILKTVQSPMVITPHPGEMARLCKSSTREIQADRLGTARRFAKEYNVIVVLKGAGTIIALPNGRAFLSTTGNPGMASAGMGDVLTGMIASLAAQGMALEDAAVAGVYIHGLCGDRLARERGGFGFVASEMIRAIPFAIHGDLS